jgi:hypothetical protein
MQPAHASLWLRPDLPLRVSGETRVGRLAQCFVHPVDSVPAHRIHPVGVAVEGELVAGVPGEVLDIRQVCPSPEQYGEAAMPLLAPLDPNPDAIRCNTEQGKEQKTLCLCGFCRSMQRSATTYRACVMSRWAVRVRSSALFFPCKTSFQTHSHGALGRRALAPVAGGWCHRLTDECAGQARSFRRQDRQVAKWALVQMNSRAPPT